MAHIYPASILFANRLNAVICSWNSERMYFNIILVLSHHYDHNDDLKQIKNIFIHWITRIQVSQSAD